MSSRTPSVTRETPPLRDGDRMDRDEFERRWDAMPELQKAELIEGVVSMPSPTSFDGHGYSHANLMGWLWLYSSQTPGTTLADAPSIRMGPRNMPQPDAVMIIEPDHGGRTVYEGRYVAGGPEFVAEVALSSIDHDRGPKLRVYQEHGVREYLLWDVEGEQVEWYVRRDAGFERLQPGEDGIICSEAFPGLWLDPAALIGQNLGRLRSVLEAGLAHESHADFVRRLREAAGTGG